MSLSKVGKQKINQEYYVLKMADSLLLSWSKGINTYAYFMKESIHIPELGLSFSLVWQQTLKEE